MPDEDGSQEQAGEPQSDIDKLRSEYDTKLAETNKALNDALGRLNAMQQTGQTQAELVEIQKMLNDVDATDPDAALARVKEIALGIGGELVQTKQASARGYSLYKDALAKYHAQVIAAESGGDPATYHKELLTATTDAAMAEKAALLKERVTLDKSRNGRRPASGGEDRQRVDEGRGAGVRTDVLAEMRNIDPSTPEGQAEWEKQRAAIKAKVNAASGINR